MPDDPAMNLYERLREGLTGATFRPPCTADDEYVGIELATGATAIVQRRGNLWERVEQPLAELLIAAHADRP